MTACGSLPGRQLCPHVSCGKDGPAPIGRKPDQRYPRSGLFIHAVPKVLDQINELREHRHPRT